mmetsp:Transcript_99878/g.279728  ORF Transcript_99878/g.279728 Transcript_99878/m.279728 type:complete len:283 (+) Transcript_99878:486-1334(+)
MGLPPHVVVDHAPGLHEDQCIGRSAVLGDADLLAGGDHQGLDAADQGQLPVAEHCELVAGEDARVLLQLGGDEVHLVAVRPEDGKAEQRRRAPNLRRAWPQALRRLVLHQARLRLLKARVRLEPLVPVRVATDALAKHPLDVLVALLADARSVACARLRALDGLLRGEEHLELLEAGGGGQVRVPLRVLVDAMLHRVHHVLVALVALRHGDAGLLAVVLLRVMALRQLRLFLRDGVGVRFLGILVQGGSIAGIAEPLVALALDELELRLQGLEELPLLRLVP